MNIRVILDGFFNYLIDCKDIIYRWMILLETCLFLDLGSAKIIIKFDRTISVFFHWDETLSSTTILLNIIVNVSVIFSIKVFSSSLLIMSNPVAFPLFNFFSIRFTSFSKIDGTGSLSLLALLPLLLVLLLSLASYLYCCKHYCHFCYCYCHYCWCFWFHKFCICVVLE